MPHVDEGVLHAYLDGALDALYEGGALPDAMTPADVMTHLDACADCRARLQIERDIRDRAGLVLRDATVPAVPIPSFDALPIAARTPRHASIWVPYAWAASLVMAVGAGWWGSQLATDRGVTSTAEEARDSGAPAQTDAPPPAAPPLADAQLQSVTPERATGATPFRERVPEVGAGAEKTAHRFEEAVRSPVAAAADTGRGAAGGIAQQRAADAAANLQRGAAVGEQRIATGAQSQTAQVTPIPLTQAATPPPAAQRPPPATPAAPPPPSPAPLSRFLGALRVVRAEGISWRDVTAADTAIIGVIGIESTTNMRIEVGRAPDIGDIVRVRQRVLSGEDVELVQWRQPAPRAMRAAADETRTLVTNVLNVQTLPDGTQQLVVHVPALNTHVAIYVTSDDPRALARRLIIVRN